MDTIKINSKWTTNLVSKILNSILRKKLGNNGIQLDLNEVTVVTAPENGDGKVIIHIDANAKITRSSIADILKKHNLL